MSEGYRGGYKLFYEAVAELTERGVFDASEVTEMPGASAGSEIDEFIALFPTRGIYKGCIARRIKDNIYNIYHESDLGQFTENIELVRGAGRLEDEFIITINISEFKYEGYRKSPFTPKAEGTFRRPDKQREESAREAKKAYRKELRKAESAGSNGSSPSSSSGPRVISSSRAVSNKYNDNRREICNTQTEEKQTGGVPSNTNERERGVVRFPKGSQISGFRRCSVIRHGDYGYVDIREQGLSNDDIRDRSREQGDITGCPKLAEEGNKRVIARRKIYVHRIRDKADRS